MIVDAKKSFYKDLDNLEDKDKILEALKELRTSATLSESKN
jgi:hypothetical protein